MKIEIKTGIGNKIINRNVLLGRFAEELFNELNDKGYIERLDKISQLGSIKTKKSQKKSRLDYVYLQLYYHDILKKKKADKNFNCTYNSGINDIKNEKFDLKIDKFKPTILDTIQILILVSNIGHFANTFSTSMGIIEACKYDANVKNSIMDEFTEDKNKELVAVLMDSFNYKQFNLAISLLVLENCNQELKSVQLAKEIVHCYVSRTNSEKLNIAFNIFANVRNMAFYTYDLPVSDIPLSIDISSEKDIETIFNEIQAKYNDNRPAIQLFDSISKLLGDSVYNSPKNVLIEYENISKQVKRKLLTHDFNKQSLISLLTDENSICNRMYKKKCNFDDNNILKLTFEKDEIDFDALFYKTSKMNNVRVGRYYRGRGKQTLVVALDKNISTHSAFNIMKYFVSVISCSAIKDKDKKYISVSLFFFYVLFGGRNVEIKPCKDVSLYVVKGNKKRLKPLEANIVVDKKDDDSHELEFIHKYLVNDNGKDTTIVMAGSMSVKKNKMDLVEDNQMELNEYDGIIIFPNRKEKQVVFLEAKNKKLKSKNGKSALTSKLRNIGIKFKYDDVEVIGKDCYYEYTN